MTARAVRPLGAPPDADVTLPGSKSISNRAFVAAALAPGPSTLEGVLVADDTMAMAACLRDLGVATEVDEETATARVVGTSGRLPAGPVELDCRLAATVARFLPPAVTVGEGTFRFDGDSQLRRRPMGPMLEALRDLGAVVTEEGGRGRLPFTVEARRTAGGRVRVPGHVSSQFASGLLLAAPAMAGPLVVEIVPPLVSRPYIDVTVAVMDAFGVAVARPSPHELAVEPVGYRPGVYRVEPDASTASYFFAAAAICGGRVRVPGLGRRSLQGDLAFVDLLERMGATVTRTDDATEVRGTGRLTGIEADLADLSDTAPTLAAVAAFADGPTRVTGIGFVRGKESDRIDAVVTELRRCGVDAEADDDGFSVRPGPVRPAVVETYGDHRIAMSFAVMGLRAEGIEIADPGCVAKTFPGFWDALEHLRAR